MSEFIQSVDERTSLAGTNRLEVLLFSLGRNLGDGRKEVFGINVFKVKEVMLIPEITKAPEMPASVEGMVCLRGDTLPVINLQKICDINPEDKPGILIVTEYNRHLQGFLVHSVDSIKRMAWGDVKVPPQIMSNRHGGLITAVSDTDDRGLVMILDVEKILSETAGLYEEEDLFDGVVNHGDVDITVLFVDDSAIARKQIEKTLKRIGYDYIVSINGQDAWDKLQKVAEEAELSGRAVKDMIQLILTDVEMPEMDGYVLTKKVKGDSRFSGIPVVMHSSLTTESNRALGVKVGTDDYVPKFEPKELASTLRRVISEHGFISG